MSYESGKWSLTDGTRVSWPVRMIGILAIFLFVMFIVFLYMGNYAEAKESVLSTALLNAISGWIVLSVAYNVMLAFGFNSRILALLVIFSLIICLGLTFFPPNASSSQGRDYEYERLTDLCLIGYMVLGGVAAMLELFLRPTKGYREEANVAE